MVAFQPAVSMMSPKDAVSEEGFTIVSGDCSHVVACANVMFVTHQ